MHPQFFNPFMGAANRYTDYDAVRIEADRDSFGALGVPRTTVYLGRTDHAASVAEEIRRTLAIYPTRIASVALVSADLSRIIADDFRRAVWLVAAAIAVLALAAFRSAKLFLLTILPVLLGCVFMLGTLGLAGVELNLMTMMGLPIVFGLGVDYGVYLVDRWSREGETPRDALAGVGPTMLVTGLTTLAGFAALLTANLAGLRSIGLAVTLGASYTLAAALFVLPLVLPERR
jgi:predicted RND superfamily exporter protein